MNRCKVEAWESDTTPRPALPLVSTQFIHLVSTRTTFYLALFVCGYLHSVRLFFCQDLVDLVLSMRYPDMFYEQLLKTN